MNKNSLSADLKSIAKEYGSTNFTHQEVLHKVSVCFDKNGVDKSNLRSLSVSFVDATIKNQDSDAYIERIAKVVEGKDLDKEFKPFTVKTSFDLKNISKMTDDELKNIVRKDVRNSALSAGYTQAELDAPCSKSSIQCDTNSSSTSYQVSPGESFLDAYSNASCEIFKTLYKELYGNKTQDQNENENNITESSQSNTQENDSVFTPKMLANMQKYKFKAKNIEEYNEAVEELKNVGLWEADSEEIENILSDNKNVDNSMFTEEEIENMQLYGIKATTRKEYDEAMEEIEQMGILGRSLSKNEDDDNLEN